MKTPGGILHPEESREFHNHVRARQESVNKRFRHWGALGEGKRVFRHDMDKHQTVFHAIVVITQIAIENGEPLFDTANYADE